MLFLLCGCSTHTQYNYADYQKSLSTDVSFYSQYEIIYTAEVNKKKQVIIAPFLADSNVYLPDEDQIIKLHLGLNIINPKDHKLNIWIDYKLTGIDTKDVVLKENFVLYRSQKSPESFYSIDMPCSSNLTNMHSQIEFYTYVTLDGNDEQILYKSSLAKYRIEGKQDLKKINLDLGERL